MKNTIIAFLSGLSVALLGFCLLLLKRVQPVINADQYIEGIEQKVNKIKQRGEGNNQQVPIDADISPKEERKQKREEQKEARKQKRNTMKTLLLILFMLPVLATAQEVAPEGWTYSQLNDSTVMMTTTYYRTRTVIDTIKGYNIVYLREEMVRVPELTRVDTLQYKGDFREFIDRMTLLPVYSDLGDSAKAVIRNYVSEQLQYPIKEILYVY